MQRKNLMIFLMLILLFVATACSENNVTAESLVGMQAPAFQLDDARGGQVALSDYIQEEMPVLLYFHMAVG